MTPKKNRKRFLRTPEWHAKMSATMRAKNEARLIGKIFGKLTVVGIAGKVSRAICIFLCGKTCEVQNGNLASGTTRSCGCIAREANWARKHGRRNSREYRIWTNMKTRCLNKRSPGYAYYGARGIVICDRWISSFVNFFEDMGPCPEGMSLERENNARGYEPDNCVWATIQQQNNNQRSNLLITAHGETHTAAEWARIAGIPAGRIYMRVRDGLSPEKSVYAGSLRNAKEKAPR